MESFTKSDFNLTPSAVTLLLHQITRANSTLPISVGTQCEATTNGITTLLWRRYWRLFKLIQTKNDGTRDSERINRPRCNSDYHEREKLLVSEHRQHCDSPNISSNVIPENCPSAIVQFQSRRSTPHQYKTKSGFVELHSSTTNSTPRNHHSTGNVHFTFYLHWIMLSYLLLCTKGEKHTQPHQGHFENDFHHQSIFTPHAAQTGSNKQSAKIIEHLSAQTPSYMFQLHERHKHDWMDFKRFGPNHLKHPLQQTVKVSSDRHFANSLGAVTAIRHHKHIGTYKTETDFFNPWKHFNHPRSDLSRTTFIDEHQLLFRIGEIPEHEQLIAGSIRLRYQPNTQVTNKLVWCDSENHRSLWPVTMWLHVEGLDRKVSRNEIHVYGSFEPDNPFCGLTWTQPNNHTMLHFPPGWFNIPLNMIVLQMLQQISKRQTEEGKTLVVVIRSIISPDHQPTLSYRDVKLSPERSSADWIHHAPHLITYHRDRELVRQAKRSRRSLADPEVTNGIHEDSMPDRKKRKVNSENIHSERTRNSQIPGRDTDQNIGQLHRPQRRSTSARRHGRDNSIQWRKGGRGQGPTWQYYAQQNGRYYDKQQQTAPYDTPTYDSYMEHTRSSPDPPQYLDILCQRRDLIVDFAAVGWSGWVIAPRTYNARFCLGHCPFPLSTHYNTTNHAVLLQLVHLLDATRVPGPCCVPHQFSPQSLLYHSQKGDVVLRVYQDMVVESCACR